jgi:hypothetical protein
VQFFNEHNTFQFESSLNFQVKGDSVQVSYPSFLFRYGLLNYLELRLAFDLASTKNGSHSDIKTGITPLQPGFKIKFNEPQAARHIPAFAVTGSVTVPKAASVVNRQTYWAPVFNFSAEQDITDKLSFEYAAGMRWDADNFQRTYFGSVNMEFDATKKFTVYADAYIFKTEQTKIDIRTDVGFNRSLNKWMQLDLSVGTGLNNYSPDFFMTAGIQFAAKSKNRAIQKSTRTQSVKESGKRTNSSGAGK